MSLHGRRTGDRPVGQGPEVGSGPEGFEDAILLQLPPVHVAGGDGPAELDHGAIGIGLDPGGNRAGTEGAEELGRFGPEPVVVGLALREPPERGHAPDVVIRRLADFTAPPAGHREEEPVAGVLAPVQQGGPAEDRHGLVQHAGAVQGDSQGVHIRRVPGPELHGPAGHGHGLAGILRDVSRERDEHPGQAVERRGGVGAILQGFAIGDLGLVETTGVRETITEIREMARIIRAEPHRLARLDYGLLEPPLRTQGTTEGVMRDRVVGGDAHGPAIKLECLVGPAQVLDDRSQTQQRTHVVGVQSERLAVGHGRLPVAAERVQGAPDSGECLSIFGPDPGRLAVHRQGVVDPVRLQESPSEIDVSIIVIRPRSDGSLEHREGLGERPARLLGTSALLQGVPQAEEMPAVPGSEPHQVAEDGDGLLTFPPVLQGVGKLVGGLRAEHPRGGIIADGLIPRASFSSVRARS